MNAATSSSTVLTAGVPLAQASAVVILVHGRGSSGDDMLGLAQHLATATDGAAGVAWLAPSARGGSWYPQRFLAPLAANEPSLTTALATIDQQVRQAEAAGVSRERIGLIGFSQGACLVFEYTARQPARYGFVAGLSGALIGPLDLPRAPVDLAATPVLVGCADHDAHIPLAHVEQTADWLEANGAAVTKQIYPGSAHSVFAPEVTWLQAALRGLRRK